MKRVMVEEESRMLREVITRVPGDVAVAVAAWRPPTPVCVEFIVQVFEQPCAVEENHGLAMAQTSSLI